MKVKQWVPCGICIANVGSSGYSTGPHLHFGTQTSAGGSIQDPYGATSSACGGTHSWWTSQGPWDGLPGLTCQ